MSELRFTISHVRPRPLPGVKRRGFTFTEVLFAVMLLGIGFVMVAAIFPVAIQQSQANRDDTTGIIVAKAGGKMMQSMQYTEKALLRTGSPSALDPDVDWGIVHRFEDFGAPNYVTLFGKVKGNLISKSDPRYAWVPLGYKLPRPMYYPDPEYPLALPDPVFPSYEVYVVAVACRNKSAYDDKDLIIPNSNKAAFTFQPKIVCFRLKDGGADPDIIEFSKPVLGLNTKPSYSAYDEPAAAEGAFVLVAHDQYLPTHIRYRQANGRIYRLGVKRTDLGVGVWELMPGRDMTNDLENIPSLPSPTDGPTSGRPAIGYMVGRGYSDPSSLRSPLDGPAQDLFAMPVTINSPLQ